MISAFYIRARLTARRVLPQAVGPTTAIRGNVPPESAEAISGGISKFADMGKDIFIRNKSGGYVYATSVLI